MKVNQIYALLNSINKEMWGSQALSVKDLSGIISLGNALEIDEDSTDKFINSLVDRIGKTVVRTLDLEIDFPNLYMDSFEFGAMMQKITVNPFDAISNSDWNVGNNGFTPTFADIHKPSVTVKYFKDSTTWSYVVTIPRDIFFTAFTSETAMSTFIDAIIKALSDSMIMAINNMSRIAIDNFIAEKIKAENGVVNILSLYNGESGTLTADKAIYDKDFLRFAGMVIRNYIGYLSEPSTMYNVDGTLRVTKRDNMHVIMLRDFMSSYVTNYSADTFNAEMTSMDGYVETSHWQGVNGGNGVPTFETNSKINVIPSSGGEAIVQTGVICMIADRQAVAVGVNKRRVGKFVNDIDDYVNTKTSATIQWINDTSENGVVFVVA